MSQENKKQPEPPREETIFESARDLGKKVFGKVAAEADYSLDEAMRRVHLMKGMVKDVYEIAEERYGKEEVLGTLAGAKAGFWRAARKPHGHVPLYLLQIAAGVIIGGIAGRVAVSPMVRKYYNTKPENNDNAKATPPTAKPEDPAP